ncbi:arsenate reductase (glutaredoxin) [Tuanshanicoccus lijuaniae]|uniref:ArsC/Spx/MgsR family protein n=1 Tax=Aerococcaceae bacterium zg-1292 TaxID=2774330 RepID=UPI0019368698|nr:arsenate reductase (glutaredoxin) [Aerococcaceae bacterium zg-1292]QQA36363.1 arsenate reductase (glutaredoxin) [Aerococcaceae bacterium zg-1292]
MEKVIIYHNSQCGTSRNTLEIIRFAGIEPEVINYLETPPTPVELTQLIAEMGISVDELIRRNVPEIVHLENDSLTDEEKIEIMTQYPILINRPIVKTSKATRLCRPSERVVEILPVDLPGVYVKEDGERVYPVGYYKE